MPVTPPKVPRKKRVKGKPRGPGNDSFKRLWADPEWAAKKIAAQRAGSNKRTGIPDGMNKKQANKHREKCREKAEHIMSEFERNKLVDFDPNMPEDQMAKKAMAEMMFIALFSGTEAIRISALKHIMEHTHAKPSAKSELTLNGADAWLASVIEDHKSDGEGA